MKLDLFKQLKKREKRVFKKRLLKAVILILVIAAGILIGTRAVIKTVLEKPNFKVTTVILESSSLTTEEAAEYCDIDLPINIFRINLERTALNIKILHPELKDVTVKRSLPGTLIIEVQHRLPVAEIEVDNKYYKVDQEGFVLSAYTREPDPQLPQILGIRNSLVLGSILRVSESRGIHDALEILQILDEEGISGKYQISKINVANHRNPSFIIDKDVEIKIRREELREKIKVLSESLPSIKLNEVEYIDLRFEDVIIGIK
jgi:cell division septal protein FtsQ